MSMTTDPLSDMFSRIRNAIAVNKSSISLPHSKLREAVAQILVENGFLKRVAIDDKSGYKTLLIDINDQEVSSTISEISRVSKPGRRVYVKAGDIPTVKRGRGIVIITTSQGLMTGQEARTRGLGGELVGKVY
jgi:small subunit ribosomal protein S8